MVDFRKKLLGLAGAAVVFSGMAFGQQTTCSTLTPNTGATFIRAEGQTELLPTLNLLCNVTAGSLVNLTLYFPVPITSKTLANGTTEATASGVAGTVTGNAITFTNVPVVAGVGSIPISNLRVNASSIPSAAGSAPSALSVTALVGGTNVTANVIQSSAVAYAVSGLSTKLSSASGGSFSGTTISVCNSTASTQFNVVVAEGFQNAFKTQADENGAVAGVGATSTAAQSGTRIKLAFANLPAGIQFYVPTSVTANDGAVLNLTGSEVGPFFPVQASTSPSSLPANSGLVAVSGTTATAVYEVTTDVPTNFDTFTIPVFAVAAANGITVQTAATTLSVSFAPITTSGTVPSFVVGSSTTAVNTLSYQICQTALLFPFVTNQAGFETGLAISNTNKDPLGKGSATQSGTCMLNYYGTSATNPTMTQAPNNNDGSITAPFAAGESYAFTLTSALAQTAGNPAGFQGYVIALCNFQAAHGFAYITYQFPGTSSSTMGYLALVLGRDSTGAESLGQ